MTRATATALETLKAAQPTCETCRFWAPHESETEEKPTSGDCIRFPPLVAVGPDSEGSLMPMTLWPCTEHDARCGEFKTNN
jgi:hypothetical protein